QVDDPGRAFADVARHVPAPGLGRMQAPVCHGCVSRGGLLAPADTAGAHNVLRRNERFNRMPGWLNNTGRWFNERLGLGEAFMPMLTHPVPRKAGWWYVFGSATLTLFLVQVFTGIFL